MQQATSNNVAEKTGARTLSYEGATTIGTKIMPEAAKLFEKTHSPQFARCNMVAVMMFLCGVAMVPLMYTRNINVVAWALTFGFFFAEMTIGPMWAIPMDIAPKFAGTASGLMNTGSALAAIVSPVVGGYLIQRTGNWTLPFKVSIGVILAGAVLSFTMHPERQFTEDASPAAAGTGR